MTKKNLRTLLLGSILLGLILGLVACGQSGKLYLPKQQVVQQ